MTLARDGDPQSGPPRRWILGEIEKMSDFEVDRILGLHPKGKVCRNDKCYESTVDGKGHLTHDPRVHDPVDGCDFA